MEVVLVRAKTHSLPQWQNVVGGCQGIAKGLSMILSK